VSALDRLQKAALVTLASTLLLVLVGASKRVLAITSGPLEDLNRVLGAGVGFAALVTLALSVVHVRRGAPLVGCALLAFVGVGAAGVLGVKGAALVEARMLALLQVGCTVVVMVALVSVAGLARAARGHARPALALGAALALVLVLVQTGLGVNARASIDALARSLPSLPREQRFENVGLIELAHMQLGPIVMLVLATLWFTTRKRHKDARLAVHTVTLALIASVAQVVLGVVLVRAGLPPLAQVLHLMGALVTVGALAAAALDAARGSVAPP
jgi:heme A synthase